MNLSDIQKRVDRAIKKANEQALQWDSVPRKVNPFHLAYRSKTGRFVASNVEIDLMNGIGTSYEWWNIYQVIKGKHVVNGYGYSNSTSKHRYKVMSVLDKLGISYIMIDAPRGLQDLDRAAHHAGYMYGQAIVNKKHARKPSSWLIGAANRQISNLKKVGVTVTEEMKNEGIKRATEEREYKLARQKRMREARKAYLAQQAQQVAA